MDAEISAPPQSSDEAAAWRRTDRLVKGWILGALSDEIVGSVAFGRDTSARDVWLFLEKALTGSIPQDQGPQPQNFVR